MSRAISLARPHHTHPNPKVGAVVVSNGVVVGEGAHSGPGKDHAEVVALTAAKTAARGATLFVTLEPCTHQGRTPPCVDALIAAGIAEVVVGAVDPDPRVAGAGIEKLRDSGLLVTVVDDESQARELDPGYFHHRETGLPLVTIKFAMTLDGAVAAEDGSSRWISGDEARTDAHRLRATMDGVMVGSGTLSADDPTLDVRHVTTDAQPVAVILAGKAELPMFARIWERDPVVVSTFDRPTPSGRLIIVPGESERPDPVEAARALGEIGIYDLLLEGGPTVAGEWWRHGLVRRGVVYLGGKIAGGAGVSPFGGLFRTISEATGVRVTAATPLGNDVRIEFE